METSVNNKGNILAYFFMFSLIGSYYYDVFLIPTFILGVAGIIGSFIEESLALKAFAFAIGSTFLASILIPDIRIFNVIFGCIIMFGSLLGSSIKKKEKPETKEIIPIVENNDSYLLSTLVIDEIFSIKTFKEKDKTSSYVSYFDDNFKFSENDVRYQNACKKLDEILMNKKKEDPNLMVIYTRKVE